MKKYYWFALVFILFSIFLFNITQETDASIYRIIDSQGNTVRVSTEPVLKEEEVEDGCKIYLLELGKRLEDFDQDNKVRGFVFLDLNENGRKDKGEQGIDNIQVSNGLDITLTDNQGYFELNQEGTFIFLTKPDDFSMTTSWYRILSDQNMSFGLKEIGDKDKENFTFIHFTDPHTTLDEKHNAIMKNTIDEMCHHNPCFIIVTGDMVLEGDKTSIEQARRWFNRYVSLIDKLDMPVYHTIGNHDVAGIFYHKDTNDQSGYDKWLYYSYFGPAYYSFDWGNFHCIVLDPNQFDEGNQYFEISEEQMSWLRKDLSFYHEEKPLLVFFHIPIHSWKNKEDILNVFGNRKVRLFSGHWHFDVLLKHQGEDVLEQVTGSLSGEWWEGSGADGRLGGYSIYQVHGDHLNRFFREIGKERQIEFIEPKPLSTGHLNVKSLIYTEHIPLISVKYQIDQEEWIPMVINYQDGWYIAQGRSDFNHLLESGYHQIKIKALDQLGEFSKKIHFKIDSEEYLLFKELYSHFSTYQGHLIQVEGELSRILTETQYTSQSHEFVNGAMILKDQSDYGGILLGEYGIPKEEELKKGQLITAEIVPLRFRWETLNRKQKLIILLNLFRLPKGFLVMENCLKPEAVQILWMINYQINEEIKVP